MQIRALCPGCGRMYDVAPDNVGPAGSEFRCDECGSRFRTDASGEVHTGGVGDTGNIAAAPRPTETIEPGPPKDTEVTCPRCTFRFAPGTATACPTPAIAGGVHLPTILVAEDTAYFRELVRETLGGRYRVVLVSSKQAAIDTIKSEEVHLLLLDLSLDDDEDGRDILREMGGKTFPILIFTARDEAEMYGECWDELQSLGADDILIKGMNVGEDLLKKVEYLLSERT